MSADAFKQTIQIVGPDEDSLLIEEPLYGIIDDLAKTGLFGDGTDIDCVLDIVRHWILDNRQHVEALIQRSIVAKRGSR